MFLGRKKSVEAFNVAAGDMCATDEACSLESLREERHLSSEFEPKGSEQLEALVHIARSWEIVTQNAGTYIDESRRSIALGNASIVASRDERRDMARSADSKLSRDLIPAHNRAVADLPTKLSVVWRDNLVKDGAPAEVLISGVTIRLTKQLNKEMDEREAGTYTQMYNGFLAAFEFEYLARAYMQVINEKNPEVLQGVFDPSTLKDLPASLQRLAVLDINHGRDGSILLDNARKVALGEKTQAERLAEYVKSGNVPDGVKRTLISINMGMQVMGSPKCPFNDMGICTHQLAKIPEGSLPEDVRKDIANRDASEAQRRSHGLMSFSQAHPVSRVFDSRVEFNEAEGRRVAQQRKRSPRAVTVEKRDMAMVESFETETQAFERVVARVINSSELFTIEDTSDAAGQQEVVKLLLGQRAFKKYLDTYPDRKVEDMIRFALDAIMLRPHYMGTDRTITPWVSARDKAFTNEEGVREKFMRYSGARASGISGGPVGRQTRIIFSQGTKNGTRYVTIHGVLNKDNMKANPTLKRS